MVLHAARLRTAGKPCLSGGFTSQAVRLRDGRVGLFQSGADPRRNARITQIYEGFSEIQRLLITRELRHYAL